MKAVACLMILVVFHQHMSRAVKTDVHVPFLVNPQTLQQSQYITVIGCHNNCDIACCYCDIRIQPPICVHCCEEEA
ncbi:hypothetical protein ACS0TY_028129 [Phlomoides rotata]